MSLRNYTVGSRTFLSLRDYTVHLRLQREIADCRGKEDHYGPGLRLHTPSA